MFDDVEARICACKTGVEHSMMGDRSDRRSGSNEISGRKRDA